MDPVTITLGGRTFLVRPLTLRQLRTVLPAFTKVASLADEAGVDNAISIVHAAIGRDAPEMTRDALLDSEATPAELAAALTAIAGLSGLVPQGGSGGGNVDWGALYGLLATACGYTWPQIDEMTLPQVHELTAYWSAHPPLHLLLAAYFGIKAKPQAAIQPSADLGALLSSAPNGVLAAADLPPM